MNKEDLLFEIANRQQGYFTTKQARECGYLESNFHRYIASGKWAKIERGIYRLTHYPLSDRPDLIEWMLWSCNKQGEIQGVWSHETALDLYDLCDIMPAKLHMTVPKRFRKYSKPSPALKLYYATLSEKDWVEQQGYRITTPQRTLLDLAETRQISDEFLKQAILEARKKGILIKQHIVSLPHDEAGNLIKKFYDEK